MESKMWLIVLFALLLLEFIRFDGMSGMMIGVVTAKEL
jgi:hypothetical protein